MNSNYKHMILWKVLIIFMSAMDWSRWMMGHFQEFEKKLSKKNLFVICKKGLESDDNRYSEFNTYLITDRVSKIFIF